MKKANANNRTNEIGEGSHSTKADTEFKKVTLRLGRPGPALFLKEGKCKNKPLEPSY